MSSTDQDWTKPFFYRRGRTAVLLVHGFTGTPYIFRELGESLAKLGYTVSAPLLAGHGTHPSDLAKTNWQDWYQTIVDEYDKLSKKADQVYVVGASFGGNLCCKLATERKLSGLILIGMPRWIYKHFLAALATPLFLFLGIQYFNKPIGKVIDNQSMLGGPNYSYLKIPMVSVRDFFHVVDDLTDGLLAKVKTPTLIIQSNRDGLVKPASGTYIFKQLATKHKALIWIDEPHHELHTSENRAQLCNYITDFMVRWS